MPPRFLPDVLSARTSLGQGRGGRPSDMQRRSIPRMRSTPRSRTHDCCRRNSLRLNLMGERERERGEDCGQVNELGGLVPQQSTSPPIRSPGDPAAVRGVRGINPSGHSKLPPPPLSPPILLPRRPQKKVPSSQIRLPPERRTGPVLAGRRLRGEDEEGPRDIRSFEVGSEGYASPLWPIQFQAHQVEP